MVPSTDFNGRETAASLSGGHCGVRRRALRPATNRARAILEIVERTRGGMGVLEKIEELSSYRGSSPLALYTGAAAGPFKN